MKIYVLTPRFGMEQTLIYHCEDAEYDRANRTLILDGEVETSVNLDTERVLLVSETILLVSDLDVVTVAQCSNACPYGHKNRERLPISATSL